VGQRRDRRLRRARQLRIGIAVAAAVAVLAGGITVLATSLTDGEAAAGTAAASPARIDRTERAVRAGAPDRSATPARKTTARLAAIRAHTTTKTEITKLPPPRPSRFPPIPPNSGAGRRVVYCNSCQRVWLVEASGATFASYTVSGRRNYPKSGTYHVFRRINPGWSKTLRLPYFVGFTYGNTTDVGFHGIPLEPDGTPIQSDSELGTPRSHGCVRQSQWAARLMWDWATMGTTVVVIP
jgi:lipoprotein-anchoring transpeptidase ErfK/SrfK